MARSSPSANLPDLASMLNQACYCHTLDRDQLIRLIGKGARLQSLAHKLAETHPHLFSTTVVFISRPVYETLLHTVEALERTMALPAWERQALQGAPALAHGHHGPLGAFMGYDFHIAPQGPMLIEINTNAGGALLCAALAGAQTRCCRDMNVPIHEYRQTDVLEDDFYAMFQAEWRLQRREQPLRTMAIVDDNPTAQYLSPEFDMLVELCAQRGLNALVVDAKDLRYREKTLFAPSPTGEQAIDLVYNRLTDFMLAEPQHAALAEAYAAGDVVLTPHPHAHALRANKRHLVTLSDPQSLARLGVADADRALLARTVPAAELVTEANAQSLWQRRAEFFFKPLDGYGARAVYRGDKITRKVWDHVAQGGYLAQAIVPPALRAMELESGVTALKFDVRAYTYQGKILLLSARTYQGQATNFRTQGGGFAPVIVLSA